MKPEHSATVVIYSKVREGHEEDFRRWQRKTNDTMRSFAGFEGVEDYPPIPGEQASWVAVFRFSSVEQLTRWLNSESRRALLDEVHPLLEGPPALEVLAGEQTRDREAVTAVISHNVRPDHERDYARWQDRMRKAQERFPGFQGFEAFEPVPGVQERWVVVVRFDTREHLDDWLESDARRKLLDEGRAYLVDHDVRTVKSAFSGWFRFSGEAAQGLPPNWKQAMSVLLALYPTVMALNLTVGQVLKAAQVPAHLALFVGNVLSVAALTWLLMPLVNRAFARWLQPKGAVPFRTNVVGTLMVLLGFALSVAVFGLISR